MSFHAGEGVERGPLTPLSENLIDTATIENSGDSFEKLEIELYMTQQPPLLSVHTKTKEAGTERDTRTPTFISTVYNS